MFELSAAARVQFEQRDGLFKIKCSIAKNKTYIKTVFLGVNVDCVEILLAHNAKRSYRDNLDRTPLMVLDDVTKKADSIRLGNAKKIAQLLVTNNCNSCNKQM